MPTRYTVVCDDHLAERVGVLAHEYDLTEEEVIRQLVSIGLDEVGEQPMA